MFKSYLLVMRMRRAPSRPLAHAVPDLFEHLLAIFAPRRLVMTLDAGELRYLTRGERGHWNGEEHTSDALTQCPPGDARALIDELRVALTRATPESLWVGAEGALLHRAPDTDQPAWYGRWRMQRALHELVEPSFSWTADERAVAIRFPHEAYPLTSTRLRAEPDGARWIDNAADAAAAVDNRARIFAVLAGIPASLGLGRDEVRWELGGDTGALRARHAADAVAVEQGVAGL